MRRDILYALEQWRHSEIRKPLLVRGARQVGKTYVVESFGESHFGNMVTINFELQPKYKACFADLDPFRITDAISVMSKQEITPGKTLLFLDEIQACPEAIVALRYFKEKYPDLHVIAAGSLLEFTLRNERLSMPVGRIQSFYLKPMSFKEFLEARGYHKLLDAFANVDLETPLHAAFADEAETLLREYFITGGMPEVVANFVESRQLNQCQIIQAGILDTYRTDFGKYANVSRQKYLEKIFEKAPGMVAQQFKYSMIDSQMKARDLKMALDDLEDAGVLHRVYSTAASGLPLITHINEKKFKTLFLDVGLVQQASGLEAELLMQKDLIQVNRGQLAEQFVGQELLAYSQNFNKANLFYWDRNKPTSTAEVDYVINVDDAIIPIEVKSGKTGSLRSMQLFLDNRSLSLGIRASLKPLSYKNRVLSVPLYMLHELTRLIKTVLQ